MKSTRDKKKSLTIDRGLDNNDKSYYYDGPNGRVIYKPAFILPKGFRGSCHLHKDIKLFKTIDALTKHNNEFHDYRLMKVL